MISGNIIALSYSHNLMIDINTGLKNDMDEASKIFIIITDKEEARKAMIAKRFGGNAKGATIGGRRKSIAVINRLSPILAPPTLGPPTLAP
jgi:hypothetical protein